MCVNDRTDDVAAFLAAYVDTCNRAGVRVDRDDLENVALLARGGC